MSQSVSAAENTVLCCSQDYAICIFGNFSCVGRLALKDTMLVCCVEGVSNRQAVVIITIVAKGIHFVNIAAACLAIEDSCTYIYYGNRTLQP